MRSQKKSAFSSLTCAICAPFYYQNSFCSSPHSCTKYCTFNRLGKKIHDFALAPSWPFFFFTTVNLLHFHHIGIPQNSSKDDRTLGSQQILTKIQTRGPALSSEQKDVVFSLHISCILSRTC